MNVFDSNVSCFVKELKKSSSRGGVHKIFRDFLELAYCAIAQRTILCSDERRKNLEAQYMRVIDPYKEDDVRFVFPRLLAFLGLAYSADDAGDALGTIAGQIEALQSGLGQFFTPYHICRMMAKLTIGDTTTFKEQFLAKKYITVDEPAVGAGANLLAFHDEAKAIGVQEHSVLYHGTDLCPMAFRMAYLNLTFAGVPALIRNGNTLSGEVFDAAWTPAAAEFYLKHGTLSFESSERKVRTRQKNG